MKKILIIFLLLTYLLNPPALFAATAATKSANSIPSSTETQLIDNLQNRIASRVAQLNLVEKRGIIGTVTDVSETQITINDLQGNIRIIDVDELTKFSSPTATKDNFGISDITKGTTIGAIGLYNKDSRRLLARFIDVLDEPKIISGGILAINKDSFTFTMATLTSDQTTVSVEDITRTVSYTKADGTVKSGFSKLLIGERVMVVGFPDVNDAKTIIASRILVFPDIPPDPKIPLVKPGDIAPITPSTGSGKKLTPIIK